MLCGMHSSHINIIVISFLHVHIVIGAGPINRGFFVTTRVRESWMDQEFFLRMVDGDATRAPNICDCCTYLRDFAPWYNVDLGKEYNITRVDVIGRGGPEDVTNSQTLRNMQVWYKSSSSKYIKLFYNPDNVYVVGYNMSSPLPARWLRFQLVNRHEFFTICELYVYAKCNNGTYGNNCDECGHCLNGAICDIEDGACVSCEAGFKGVRCFQNCSAGEYGIDCAETCGFCKKGDVCDRINGTCIECQDGFILPLCKDCVDYKFGENCTSICQHCAGGPCNKISGVCPPGGCIKGYKGVKCDTECNRTYGFNCNETCGSCYNNAVCNRFNGSCPHSHCAAGFRGDKCKQACMSGSYGQNCSEICGYCTNGEICAFVTGVCLRGCSDGYNGTLCKTTCQSRTFGKNCNSTCGNCINGDICRFDNGYCERGCEPGFQPPTCLKVTEPEPSSNLSTEEIAGSAAGGLFFIGLIVVGVIIVCRQRLKSSREHATERRNGENRPYIHMESPYAVLKYTVSLR